VLTRPVAADSPCYRVTKSPLKSLLDRHTVESSLKVRFPGQHVCDMREEETNNMRSRGQHERTNGEHQRHPARRQSHSPGPRVHPWLARAPIYRSRYAEVSGEMLQEGTRTATDEFSHRNAPMFRSRGTRGRGVGLARGRATVNRARGQRGAPR
jgi:hypothetical protein